MDARMITRRQILKQFGAVGGSSLVMGTMDAWDLMGQPSGHLLPGEIMPFGYLKHSGNAIGARRR